MRQRTRPLEPGNTGEWFFGVIDDSPISTLRPDLPPLPADLSMQIPRRRFRLSVVLAVLLFLAVLGIGASWLIGLPERIAAERETDIDAAAAELADASPALLEAIRLTGDPATPIDELNTAQALAGIYLVAATDAAEVAGRPLPRVPPGIPAGPVDDLGPIQTTLALGAADANGLGTRITDVSEYRIRDAEVLDVPNLPRTATAATMGPLAADLARILADGSAAFERLPTVDVLTDHRNLVAQMLDRFESWQIEYLEALRRDDFEATGELLTEWAGLASTRADALADGLDVFERNAVATVQRVVATMDQITAQL